MPDQDYDSRYLQFFECFNQQRFFEAHEVLEALWLPHRQGPDGGFYQGLIQLAGAFVHLQKARLNPAKRLLELARKNLLAYPASHKGLALGAVLVVIEEWLVQLEAANSSAEVFKLANAPRLHLQDRSQDSHRSERRG